MSIEKIDKNFNVADPLTKGLLPKMFHEHITCISVISFENIQFQ